MERGHLWRTCFKSSLAFLELNSAGLSDELAARRPAEGLASAAWILGHLVMTRRHILGLLGAPPAPDPVWEPYGRRGDGVSGTLAYAELLAAFRATDAPLREALRAVPDWDRPTMNPGLKVEQPLEQVVAFLLSHESYHLGQLGVIRRLLGLAGAI
jgi:uncharacterized damage-inducible protein DinB